MLRIKKFDGVLTLDNGVKISGRMGLSESTKINEFSGVVTDETNIKFSPYPPYSGELTKLANFKSKIAGFEDVTVEVVRENPMIFTLNKQ